MDRLLHPFARLLRSQPLSLLTSGYVVRPHIACPGVAVNNCPANSIPIQMNSTLQTAILNKRNSYRNALAGGTVNGFATASRMSEMKWYSKLAFVAAKNAMQCIYGHDQCRNTWRYPYSGQNIAYAWGSMYGTNKIFVEAMIDMWWNEYSKCTQAVLDSYYFSGVIIEHFTQIVSDRSNQVGCAGVLFNGNYRYIVCNYARTCMMGEPVYKKDTIRSGFKTGGSPTYTNLCSVNEVV